MNIGGSTPKKTSIEGCHNNFVKAKVNHKTKSYIDKLEYPGWFSILEKRL